MTHRHPDDEAHERVLALVHYRTVTRLVMDVGLLVGLLGITVPFGLHDTGSYDINAWEWILAGLALVALVGIVVDLVSTQTLPWPFGLAAFVWAAQATYAALLPGAIIGARLGLALVFAGYAVASAGAWRIVASYARTRR